MKFHFVLKSTLPVILTFLFLFYESAHASNYDPKIEELQRALILTGFNPGKVDGLWGGRTEDALKKFFDNQGLELESVDYENAVHLIFTLWNKQREADERNTDYLQEKLNLDDARHLLERTGIGANIKDIKKVLGLTRSEAVTHIIDELRTENWLPLPKFLEGPTPPYWINSDLNSEEEQAFRVARDREMNEYRLWWVREMIETPYPQTEQLVLFWHNHFVSAYSAINEQSTSIARQNMMFRELGIGNFKILTKAVIRDPAMLNYLDNENSQKGKPNENLSRELMELFVLGEGNYSEETVKEGARALTGYSVNKLRDTSFYFSDWNHDDGIKNIFGKSGNFNGDQFVDILFEQPASSKFIVRRFWRHFVSEVFENEQELEEISRKFKKSDFDIRTLYRAILTSTSFWQKEARATIVKSPVDFLIGTIRKTGFLPSDWTSLPNKLTTLGQNLFEHPNVAGWPGGQSWITPSGLLSRSYLAKNFFSSLGSQVESMVNAKDSSAEMTKRSITLRYASEDFRGAPKFTIRLIKRKEIKKSNGVIEFKKVLVHSSTHISKNGHDTAKFGRIEDESLLPWQSLNLNIGADEEFDYVEVAFINDHCCGPGGSQSGDRNFFVDWVKVDNDLFLASAGTQHGNNCDSDPGKLYCSGYVQIKKPISLLESKESNQVNSQEKDKLVVERVALSWMNRFKKNRDWNEIAINLLNSKFNHIQYDALRIKFVGRKNGDIFLMVSSDNCYPDCFGNKWPQKVHKNINPPYQKDIKISLIRRNNRDHEAHYWGLTEVDRKFVDALWASFPQMLEELKNGRKWKRAAERRRTEGWKETIDYILKTLPKTRYAKSAGSNPLVVRPASENGGMMAMMGVIDMSLPYPSGTKPLTNLSEIRESFGKDYFSKLQNLFLATDPVIIAKTSKDISEIITDPVYNLK